VVASNARGRLKCVWSPQTMSVVICVRFWLGWLVGWLLCAYEEHEVDNTLHASNRSTRGKFINVLINW
jgi:hypothetical protein